MIGLADNRISSSYSARLRRRRFDRFLRMLPPGAGRVRVLDVGGTPGFWQSQWCEERCGRLSVVVLNLDTPAGVSFESDLPVTVVRGDARDLSSIGDGEFDVCFSNSVIEHVGTFADQCQMASEVRRVGERYCIQTPYRYFPVEPHFHVPFWAQLPTALRTRAHQRFHLGWMPPEADYLRARAEVEQVRLLSIREVRLLFPDATLEFERVGPLIKSITAVRA
jgi:SAM-dependent methyltransferase